MQRRTLYWLGGILFAVLQINFWIAPWPSRLAEFSLWGSGILGGALLIDGLFQNRNSIWRFIQSMRR